MQPTRTRRGQRSRGAWAWPDSESKDGKEEEFAHLYGIEILRRGWEMHLLMQFGLSQKLFLVLSVEPVELRQTLSSSSCAINSWPEIRVQVWASLIIKCKTQHTIAKTANDFLCWSFSQLSGRCVWGGKTAEEAISTRYCDFENYLKECSVTINVGDCWGMKCAVCLSNTVNLNIIQ